MFYSKADTPTSRNHMERRISAAEANRLFSRSAVRGHTFSAMVLGGSEDFVLLPFSRSTASAGKEELVQEDLADTV